MRSVVSLGLDGTVMIPTLGRVRNETLPSGERFVQRAVM
jgi:hypothetical protein